MGITSCRYTESWVLLVQCVFCMCEVKCNEYKRISQIDFILSVYIIIIIMVMHFFIYTKVKEWMSSIRHHRHWQTVYRHVSGCKLSMFDFIIPRYNSILGGTMTLHGNRFKLVCFHGTNFRSKLWALFTLDEPTVHFETKVWQPSPGQCNFRSF